MRLERSFFIGFLAPSVVVIYCEVIRTARMGSSDLLVCVFACSFLFFSDLLFWNGIHGKEAGFIKDGGRECTEYHPFERKAGEKSEVLLEEGGMHLRCGEEGLGKPKPCF
jgi:hypothetical protein